MESLPSNVLEKIVSLLPLTDQKAASLTCRKLYITLSQSIFLLKRRYILRESIAKTNFLFCDSNFINGRDSESTQLNLYSPSVSRCWSNWITSLSFKYSHPDPIELTFLLQKCPRLQSLDLTECDNLFDISLCTSTFLSEAADRNAISECLNSSTIKLTLANISTLNDVHLKNLFETFRGVRDIDLSGCLLDFNSSSVDCESSLTFANLLSLISGLGINSSFKKPCGGTLRLNSTSINDMSLSALATTPGLYLCGIYLDNCRELSDGGLLSLIMSNSVSNCLKEISCGYPGHRVTFRVAEALLKRFANTLTYVRLTNWSFLANPRICSLLQKCLAIEYLDVTSCFTCSNLLTRSFSLHFGRLTGLVLSGHSDLSDEDLNTIFKNLNGHLKLLDVSSCVCLTDLSLSAVYTYFPCLETLLARWCKGFTDSGICNIRTDISSVSDPGLFGLKNLKSVDLSDCGKITGSSFTCKYVGNFKMQKLQSFRIGRIGSLRGSILDSIPYIAPQLRILDISRSSADDETVKLLTYRLQNTLRELFVSGCENLTDQCLVNIFHNIPFLQILDVSFCSFISQEAVSTFRKSMPYLHYVKAIYIGSRLRSAQFI
ncbi:unnamed protein product [Schistosoma turkestanicum]|nr:unnamed protein product [Schistosoma turkestanicum]